MSAEYDEASKSIKLSWSYSGDGDVSFKVKQSVDGGGYSEIQNSSAKEAVIPNAKEGSVYRFQVTAVTEDGESDPASVTLKVNAADEDESKRTMKRKTMTRRSRMLMMIRTKTNKITAIQISRMIKIQEIPIKTIKIREIQTKTTAEKMMTPMIKTTIKIKIKIKTKTKPGSRRQHR